MKLSNHFIAVIFVGALLGSSPTGVQAAETTTKPAETKKPGTKTDRMDINTASLDQLKALRGINEAQAKKIVEGRPYKRRNELLSKKILPQESYDKVKDQVSTRPPTK